ncbi:uncharacterized protein LOC129002037 isoform X2 [Macrosteles quadrilineatus]|uniref:uncharacterized protein LOC129002037 isoform X2 n=1 Tax=Macrosteles quadrilineatus TaxID=74068 RepID=UPI0023E0A5D5|nr:uncharacterized protein LOC129002037 isoform X2 [Macrosteles quadrilineatus]
MCLSDQSMDIFLLAVGVASELDTNLIVGQALPVTLLKVQEDYTVYAQPASEDGELQSLELQPGQGVKCVLSNVKETATDEQRQAFTQLPADTYVIMLVDAAQSEGAFSLDLRLGIDW